MFKGFVKKYWDERYQSGGDSGIGSYDLEAAKFKSDYINNLILLNHFKTIVELGCGDGHQLGKFSKYEKYTGYDISEVAIDICSNKFKGDKTKEFVKDINEIINKKYDLALSLDVIYHLVEDSLFKDHLDALFSISENICLYTTNFVSDEFTSPHVKHRDVEEYIKTNYPNFELIDRKLFEKYNVMFLLYKQK